MLQKPARGDSREVVADGSDQVWGILETLAGSDVAADNWSLAGEFDLGAADWGRIIHLALWHKVYPLLAAGMVLRMEPDALPKYLSRQFHEVVRVNRHRASLFRHQASLFTSALEKRGVAVACTKGVALDALVYGDRGLRFSLDIDLMIAPGDRSVVEEVFADEGYVVGDDGAGSAEIRPIERQEMLLYRLFPDHLPPRVIELGDPILPLCPVDVAFSLTWHRSQYQLDMNRVMAELRRVRSGGVELPTLSNFHHFLFVVLHLFREAWIDPWDRPHRDVVLHKFMDVHRIFRTFRRELIERRDEIRELGLAEPVSWVLGHADTLFGTDSVDQLGLSDAATCDWLASAQAGDGALVYWHGDLRRRMLTPTVRDAFHASPPGGPGA